MFTKNWYKIAASVFSRIKVTLTTIPGGSYEDTLTSGDCLCYGGKYDIYNCPSMHYVRTAYNAKGGVVFGTGTTPPTIDDYCLSGDLITTISYSAVVSNAGDDDGITTTALYTVTNTSSEDITIGEIGLIESATAGNSTQSYKVLMERTVLETPITVPAGGVGQVTYTIRMNYPTV